MRIVLPRFAFVVIVRSGGELAGLAVGIFARFTVVFVMTPFVTGILAWFARMVAAFVARVFARLANTIRAFTIRIFTRFMFVASRLPFDVFARFAIMPTRFPLGVLARLAFVMPRFPLGVFARFVFAHGVFARLRVGPTLAMAVVVAPMASPTFLRGARFRFISGRVAGNQLGRLRPRFGFLMIQMAGR